MPCDLICGHVLRDQDGRAISAPCKRPRAHRGNHTSWAEADPKSPCRKCEREQCSTTS